MEKIKTFLKRLFCDHEWKDIKDVYPVTHMENGFPVIELVEHEVCQKCGKERYRRFYITGRFS